MAMPTSANRGQVRAAVTDRRAARQVHAQFGRDARGEVALVGLVETPGHLAAVTAVDKLQARAAAAVALLRDLPFLDAVERRDLPRSWSDVDVRGGDAADPDQLNGILRDTGVGGPVRPQRSSSMPRTGEPSAPASSRRNGARLVA
jgi:hypothetical protein